MPSYIVNGREYSSIDEMPAEDRQAYQQAMQAIAENGGFSSLFNQKGTSVQTSQTTNVSVHKVMGADNKQLSELLSDRDGNGVPDIMEQSDAKLNQLFTDRDGNGIPDILEGQANGGSTQTTPYANPWKASTPSVDPLGSSPLPWNQPQQGASFGLGLVIGGVVIGVSLLIWLILL